LETQPLVLETDIDERDDFGQLLAYVWAGDVFVNERLILDGYARAHDYPPNLSRRVQLWEATDRARAAGVRIWAEGQD
jgi:micrococcal nuclease